MPRKSPGTSCSTGKGAAMRIENTKLGDLEIEDARIVTLPEGILGFSDAHRYVVLDIRKGSDMKWFLSVDRPELAFVVTDPYVWFPEYEMPLGDSDAGVLGFRNDDELSVLAIVTVRGRRKEETTMNLRAPIAVNLRTLLGKQVVLSEDRWGIQVPLPVRIPSLSGATDRRSPGLR
jgi:flagellar assembly factor FliW